MLGWQRLNSTEVARSKSRNFFSTPALLAPAPVRFVCSSSEKCASQALITLASAGRGQGERWGADVVEREKGSQLKAAFPSIPPNRNRYRGNVKIMSSHTCRCSSLNLHREALYCFWCAWRLRLLFSLQLFSFRFHTPELMVLKDQVGRLSLTGLVAMVELKKGATRITSFQYEDL